jgi:single-stranded-DNA-specific exonuclease
MQKRWYIKNFDPKLKNEFANELSIDPILAQLLINRDVTTLPEAQQFLYGDLSQTADPFKFKGMDRAVSRIKQAQQSNERVLVYGDYDVDGVTSSALLNSILSQMGIRVIHHIPHRMREGYGLNHAIAEFAKQQDVKLLIAVDCGISANEEVKTINSLGIDVIIIDHHEPDAEIPPAYAVINPKQKDCPYPFKYFASVGLVTKVIQALSGKIEQDLLDLTAIGTIADVVPLRGENRIFVKEGLPRIAQTKNKGLLALLDIAKIKGKKISPYHVGFILGPRINAAGRMDSAHDSLDLFLSDDWDKAYELAKVLEKHNSQRQRMQQEVAQEAFEMIEQEINFKDHKVIVLGKEGWHKGVLGIVASKIMDKYYRPTIVISLTNGVGTASARSVEGFHLYDVLSNCSEFLENFGGHQAAAGLTIREDQIDPFRVLINEIAHKVLVARELIPLVAIDSEIPLSSATLGLAEMIAAMEPFGEGNPSPVFCTRALKVKSYPAILGKETLKFWVSDGENVISAVGFGMAKYSPLIKPGSDINLAYELTIDDWNKAPTAQLKIKDIQVCE